MVRRGCERGTKTTSGASIPSKRFSYTQDYLDLRRVPQGKGQETRAERVGSTYWVITAKSEAKAVCLIHVEWICIQDANVHFPLLEVRGRYEVNPWGKGLLNLRFGKLDQCSGGEALRSYLGEFLEERSAVRRRGNGRGVGSHFPQTFISKHDGVVDNMKATKALIDNKRS